MNSCRHHFTARICPYQKAVLCNQHMSSHEVSLTCWRQQPQRACPPCRCPQSPRSAAAAPRPPGASPAPAPIHMKSCCLGMLKDVTYACLTAKSCACSCLKALQCILAALITRVSITRNLVSRKLPQPLLAWTHRHMGSSLLPTGTMHCMLIMCCKRGNTRQT